MGAIMTIGPEEAKEHIGENVSVRGLVELVSVSKKGPIAALTLAKLDIACTKLLDERRIHLDFDDLHIDWLRFIPPANLGQHLSGFEAISRPSV